MADRHGTATKRRIVTLFDRRVERVHVDVDDLTDGRIGHVKPRRGRRLGVRLAVA
jgi:hypothetical protein